MALRDVDIPVIFQSGAEGKVDENALPVRVVRLIDAVFDDQNTVRTRGGHSAMLTSASSTSGTLPNEFRRIWAHRETPMLDAKNGMFRLLASPLGPQRVESLPRANRSDTVGVNHFKRAGMVTSSVSGTIERWPAGLSQPAKTSNLDADVDTAAGSSVWAWEESQPNGRMSIGMALVQESGQTVLKQTLLTTDIITNQIRTSPRVVSVGSGIFYVYFATWGSGTAVMRFHTVRVSTSTASFGAETALSASVNTGATGATGWTDPSGVPLFDVVYCPLNACIGFVWRIHSDATKVNCIDLDPVNGVTNFFGGGALGARTIGSIRSLRAVLTSETSGAVTTEYVQVVCTVGDSTLRGFAWDIGTIGASTPGEIYDVGGSAVLGRITGIDFEGPTSSLFDIYIDCDPTGAAPTATTNQIYKITALKQDPTDQGVVSASFLYSGWHIYGQVVKQDGDPLLPVANLDPQGPSIFLLCRDYAGGPPYVLARVCRGEAGYLANEWHPSMRVANTLLTSSSTLTVPFPKWVADLQVTGDRITTPVVISRADIDQLDALGSLEVNGLTLLAGASPQYFDGVVSVEAGMHHAPRLSNAAGGSSGSGKVVYLCAVEEWQDAAGNLHTGPPSNVIEVPDMATTGDDWTVDISWVPGVAPTKKVSVFRTAVDSTGPFYRAVSEGGVNVPESTLFPTGQFALVPDTLYSTGAAGEPLPYEAVPPCRHLTTWDGRVWLAPGDDGQSVYFSNVVEEAFAPEFSPLFRRRVPRSWGRVVGCAAAGDRLVVICERKIGAIFGAGPTPSGEQDNYSQITPIVEHIGGVWGAPNSIVSTAEGVWFQSRFGIRLLGGGGIVRTEAHEAGAEFDSAIVGTTLTLSAIPVPGKQQARFYASSGGRSFVWDSQWRQWCEFSFSGLSATVAGDDVYIIRSSSVVWKDDDTLVEDAGTGFGASLKTAPIQVAGFQGLQRIRRINILGKQGESGEDVSISLAGFFDGEAPVALVNSQPATPNSQGNFQAQHHLVRQKCQSLALFISWFTLSEFAKPRLTGITLSAGVKLSHPKLPSSKRIS